MTVHTGPRQRFWVETGTALVSGFLVLLTLIWHNWIEIVFKVDPDLSSGLLEWLIVAACLAIMLASAGLARREWYRRPALQR